MAKLLRNEIKSSSGEKLLKYKHKNILNLYKFQVLSNMIQDTKAEMKIKTANVQRWS